MPPERCSVKGCGHDASFAPQLQVRGEPLRTGAPTMIPMVLGLPICRACARDTTLEHVMGDQGWEYVQAAARAAGLAAKRGKVRLRMVPLSDPAYVVLRENRRPEA